MKWQMAVEGDCGEAGQCEEFLDCAIGAGYLTICCHLPKAHLRREHEATIWIDGRRCGLTWPTIEPAP